MQNTVTNVVNAAVTNAIAAWEKAKKEMQAAGMGADWYYIDMHKTNYAKVSVLYDGEDDSVNLFTCFNGETAVDAIITHAMQRKETYACIMYKTAEGEIYEL